jgi:hypothetical protein
LKTADLQRALDYARLDKELESFAERQALAELQRQTLTETQQRKKEA